jgi:hypothetical protein
LLYIYDVFRLEIFQCSLFATIYSSSHSWLLNMLSLLLLK